MVIVLKQLRKHLIFQQNFRLLISFSFFRRTSQKLGVLIAVLANFLVEIKALFIDMLAASRKLYVRKC